MINIQYELNFDKVYWYLLWITDIKRRRITNRIKAVNTSVRLLVQDFTEIETNCPHRFKLRIT